MPERLLAGYAAPDDRYDELLAAPGQPRPHWDAFMRSLAERSEREVSDTLRLVRRRPADGHPGRDRGGAQCNPGGHQPWAPANAPGGVTRRGCGRCWYRVPGSDLFLPKD